MKYHESQQVMPQWVLLAVVAINVGLFLLFAYIFYSQTVLEKPFGEKPISSEMALLLCLLVGLIIYFVYRLRIRIKVTDQELLVNLGSWVGKKNIKLTDIEQVTDYVGNPAADFLGFGYRFGLKQTGFVGRPKEAIVLDIKGQTRQLVITTNNPEKLKSALR
ncbi:MAG: hypothetical protein HWD86_09480 [Kangiellaceae bacterium]|nr:hypothetical protein [Kangiellaceae bacterium]